MDTNMSLNTNMDSKETLLKTYEVESLMRNEDYFKYVFKKTEKIVGAVFYILRAGESVDKKDFVVSEIERVANELMDSMYKTLRPMGGVRQSRIEEVSYALLILESKLTVGAAAMVIDGELLTVFRHEIHSVQRSLKDYASLNGGVSLFGDTPDAHTKVTSTRKIERQTVVPKNVAPRGEGEGVSLPVPVAPIAHGVGRRERVLSVLKERGEATIKDISEIVTDCSEKTIQRELIDMIKDGIIVREGERRWSKYRII